MRTVVRAPSASTTVSRVRPSSVRTTRGTGWLGDTRAMCSRASIWKSTSDTGSEGLLILNTYRVPSADSTAQFWSRSPASDFTLPSMP